MLHCLYTLQDDVKSMSDEEKLKVVGIVMAIGMSGDEEAVKVLGDFNVE